MLLTAFDLKWASPVKAHFLSSSRSLITHLIPDIYEKEVLSQHHDLHDKEMLLY